MVISKENEVEKVAPETGRGAPLLPKKRKSDSLKQARRRETVFYICCIIIPLVQFMIYYVYVHLNAFLLAFQTYDYADKSFLWYGLKNFERIFIELGNKGSILRNSLFTSIIVRLLGYISLPIDLLIPYFVFKKRPGHKYVAVITYLPTVLSGMVMSLTFKYITDMVIPELWLEWFEVELKPLLSTEATRFWTMWINNLIASIGGSVLMYVSTMSRIPDSLIEYTRLEGCGAVKEFFLLTFPMIYSLFSVYFIAGVADIFTNQFNLFTYFGTSSTSLSTIGYYSYCLIVDSSGYTNYPYAASIGMFFTLFAAPLTLIIRWIMNKLDPQVSF